MLEGAGWCVRDGAPSSADPAPRSLPGGLAREAPCTPPQRAALLAATAVLPVPSALAQAATPAAVIEGFHAALLDTMRNARALGPRGRERRLRPAMQAAFNLPAMTRIAVGPPWTGLSEAERQALVTAFSDWSIATYASRFDGYAGESFAIVGEAPCRAATAWSGPRSCAPTTSRCS